MSKPRKKPRRKGRAAQARREGKPFKVHVPPSDPLNKSNASVPELEFVFDAQAKPVNIDSVIAEMLVAMVLQDDSG